MSINCKYFDKGNCKLFGNKIKISCEQVSNMSPEECRAAQHGGKKRKNKRSKRRRWDDEMDWD